MVNVSPDWRNSRLDSAAIRSTNVLLVGAASIPENLPTRTRECCLSTRPLKKSLWSAAIRSTPKRDVRAAVLRAFERRPRQIGCRETGLGIRCRTFQRSPTIWALCRPARDVPGGLGSGLSVQAPRAAERGQRPGCRRVYVEWRSPSRCDTAPRERRTAPLGGCRNVRHGSGGLARRLRGNRARAPRPQERSTNVKAIDGASFEAHGSGPCAAGRLVST
jgi:hypothetical protein